jgi:hypothetical protein
VLDPRFSYTIREEKDKVLPAWTRWATAIGFIVGVALVLAVLHMFLEAL